MGANAIKDFKMGEINIDGTPDYEGSVADVLKTIKRNMVGNIIVGAIEGQDRDLTLVPFDKGKAAVYGDCNATTRSENLRASAPEGITGSLPGASGWYAGHNDDPRTSKDERDDRVPYPLKGTGAGSDVHIFFTPDADPSGKSSCAGGVFGSQPDEVLVHEMVHGLRHMQGKRNPIPTKDPGYDNEEEFLAIVVTNVYMSANNKVKLRADHNGYLPLKAPLDTSAGFLADAENLKLMNIYKLIWQPQFWFLAQVAAAKFNPFRELTARLAYLTGGRPFK
jgi:hypothetical protein